MPRIPSLLTLLRQNLDPLPTASIAAVSGITTKALALALAPVPAPAWIRVRIQRMVQ